MSVSLGSLLQSSKAEILSCYSVLIKSDIVWFSWHYNKVVELSSYVSESVRVGQENRRHSMFCGQKGLLGIRGLLDCWKSWGVLKARQASGKEADTGYVILRQQGSGFSGTSQQAAASLRNLWEAPRLPPSAAATRMGSQELPRKPLWISHLLQAGCSCL